MDSTRLLGVIGALLGVGTNANSWTLGCPSVVQDFTRYRNHEAGKFLVIGLDQKRTAKRSSLKLFGQESHGVLIPIALRPPLRLNCQERQIRADFEPEIRAAVLIHH